VLIGPEFGVTRDAVYEALKAEQIMARRYFYPLISDFPMYRSLPSANPANLPVAREVADQVLCLPIFPDLSDAEATRVVDVLLASRTVPQPSGKAVGSAAPVGSVVATH